MPNRQRKTRKHRRKSRRGGAAIAYTQCGPACPYFSQTPQYSGGRKKRRKHKTRRRRRRRKHKTRHRRRK